MRSGNLKKWNLLCISFFVASLTVMNPFSLPNSIGQETDADESWPQWRGPNGDGHSASTDLLDSWEKAPELLWVAKGLGNGYSSVSIADDKIFTVGDIKAGNGQFLIALDVKEKGQVLWATKITDSIPNHGYKGSRSTPSYSDGKVYMVASDGQIVCCNAEDGKVAWRKSFQKEWDGRMMSGWGFSESPLVDGDKVICTPGGKDAGIVALNKATGDLIWKTAIPDFDNKNKYFDGKNKHGKFLKRGAAYCSVSKAKLAGVPMYIQFLGQGVVGVDAETGKFLWGYDQAANNVANISNPIAHNDQVLISSAYGTGSALISLSKSKKSGRIEVKERYFKSQKQLQNHHGGMIRHKAYVFCGHKQNQGWPVCMTFVDGKIKWGGRIRPVGDGSAAVLYADGKLIFRYENGTVALIDADPTSYKLKGSFMPKHQDGKSWAHPVVVDGLLFLREQDHLMCYNLRKN